MNQGIRYAIISRGDMEITWGDKKTLVTGELTFTPPVFYADLKSLQKWESGEEITREEKSEIINELTQSSQDNATRIQFD